MAVAAKKLENEFAYMPATRVYSNAAALRARREAVEAEISRKKKIDRAARAKAAGREALRKLFMVISAGVAMASILLMLIRYSNINHQYAAVNDLKSDIDTVKLEINALNVQLNSAVSLQEAREAAEGAGLGYPKGEQIITVESRNSQAKTVQNDLAEEIEVLE